MSEAYTRIILIFSDTNLKIFYQNAIEYTKKLKWKFYSNFVIKHKKVFALSAALLGARFRSNDGSLLGASGGEDGCSPNFEVPAGVNMGRRRSRAVLYQLSGHYKPEKIKTKLKLNNVSGWPQF